MAPRLALRQSASLQGRLKLARLLSLSEEELGRLAVELESTPLFAALGAAGAVRLTPFPQAYFTARRFAGRRLMDAGGAELARLLDGRSELVRLMRRVGRERFEACFLSREPLSDAERARRCALSPEEARLLRDFVDRLFIRSELLDAPEPPPATVFSTVAGIAIERGRPVLRFFHREVWKGRYAVDEERVRAYLAERPGERAKVEATLSRLAFLDRRKTTLLRVLEELLRAQAEFLRSGDPARRAPLTQRAIAAAVGADPSVIHRLIANKAVELPWGTEAPLKALFPSGKALARQTLAALARAEPALSDEGLRRALAHRHQIHLSRRSVAQYRKELRLGSRGRR